MKVYFIECHSQDYHEVVAVYLDKESADAVCIRMNEETDSYSHYTMRVLDTDDYDASYIKLGLNAYNCLLYNDSRIEVVKACNYMNTSGSRRVQEFLPHTPMVTVFSKTEDEAREQAEKLFKEAGCWY